MPNLPPVSIVMVSWNNADYLSRCLLSLSQQSFQDFEIILVDNGSRDGVPGSLQEYYPSLDLHIQKLDTNLGFAAANNIGARAARGKWLVLLNTDAFPEPDWLEKLLDAAQSHSEMACFTSRQIQANNPHVLDGMGDAYHVSGIAWRIGLGYPIGASGLDSVRLFSPCAAAAMYLREAFLDVGGFDEDFFSYFEDVDLGFRLLLRGYRCMYVPEALVYHVGSASLGLRSDFAFYHTQRNLIWTYFKNMPAGLLWLYMPQHVLLNFTYLIYYTLLGRGKVLWKAKWDAMLGLPKALEKRRAIQRVRRFSNDDLRHRMEHGWLQPYRLSAKLRKTLQNNRMERS